MNFLQPEALPPWWPLECIFKTFSLFRPTAMITIYIVKLTLLFNNLPQLWRSCEGNLKKKASKKDISFTRTPSNKLYVRWKSQVRTKQRFAARFSVFWFVCVCVLGASPLPLWSQCSWLHSAISTVFESCREELASPSGPVSAVQWMSPARQAICLSLSDPFFQHLAFGVAFLYMTHIHYVQRSIMPLDLWIQLFFSPITAVA